MNKEQAVANDSNTLPKFDQVIKIEVEVERIHEKLMLTFPPDYVHKNTLSHAIIGSALAGNKLLYIYNSLNGFSNEIDFKVGEIVMCTEEERKEAYDSKQYDARGLEKVDAEDPTVEGYKPSRSIREIAIGACEIVAIDLYADKKLKVKYMQDERYNERREEIEEWVNHKNCKFYAKTWGDLA